MSVFLLPALCHSRPPLQLINRFFCVIVFSVILYKFLTVIVDGNRFNFLEILRICPENVICSGQLLKFLRLKYIVNLRVFFKDVSQDRI